MSQPMPAVTADETFDGTWPFHARSRPFQPRERTHLVAMWAQ